MNGPEIATRVREPGRARRPARTGVSCFSRLKLRLQKLSGKRRRVAAIWHWWKDQNKLLSALQFQVNRQGGNMAQKSPRIRSHGGFAWSFVVLLLASTGVAFSKPVAMPNPALDPAKATTSQDAPDSLDSLEAVLDTGLGQ